MPTASFVGCLKYSLRRRHRHLAVGVFHHSCSGCDRTNVSVASLTFERIRSLWYGSAQWRKASHRPAQRTNFLNISGQSYWTSSRIYGFGYHVSKNIESCTPENLRAVQISPRTCQRWSWPGLFSHPNCATLHIVKFWILIPFINIKWLTLCWNGQSQQNP
jgi:hypothetical protein